MPVLAIRAHKSPFRAASARETLEKNLIGNNVGNLVFTEATFRLLARSDHVLEPLPSRATKVPERVDVLVLPLANAFRRSFLPWLDRLTAMIHQADVPVVVLGVGAQARLGREDASDPEVDAGTRAFVAAVLEHGPSIGVRGEHTYDYLRRLGFPDEAVDVIGCPSMFYDGPTFPALRPTPDRLDTDTRLAFNASPYLDGIGPLSLEIAHEHPRASYFAQDIDSLHLLLRGTYTGGRIRPDAPITLDHPLIAEGRTLMCLDPATWRHHLSEFEFSLGTRLHGTVTALLSGTPATVLTHDTRTLELAELHHIPHVPFAAARKALAISEVVERSDFGPLRRGHRANWDRFATYLARHRLSHVWEHGQSPATFDQRLAALDLPGPVRPLSAWPLEDLYDLKRTADGGRGLRAAVRRFAGPRAPRGLRRALRRS